MSIEKELDRVVVFDTTLRDGEQSPGASMDLAGKRRVAMALERLGVDVIELGFPASSPGDFEAVRTVSRELERPVSCALARAQVGDIEAVAKALDGAAKKRIHIFLATSPIHREHKLRLAQAEIIRRATEAIQHARRYFDDIEFSPEDAARTEPDFLAEVVERVIEAGATTVNIPDTVGFAMPAQYAATIAHLKKTVRGIDNVVLSVHCHDDLGLAVANSLSGLMAGARQVECTINGIGERAGNCALEEIVMAMKTRSDFIGLRTNVRSELLCHTSRVVSDVTGLQVQRNKAIVGMNAFAHEAGIHQHGMLRHPGTYEIMRPDDVGFGKSRLVLGKHSGRHSVRERLLELGFRLDDAMLEVAFARFKGLADRRKEVSDSDLMMLAESVLSERGIDAKEASHGGAA